MDEIASFGDWLKARRKALHLIQEELAHQLGVAFGTLRKLESDERRPSPEIAHRLAERLDISPAARSTFVRVARGELTLDHLLDLVPPGHETGGRRLPSGTVTLLASDVAGSTHLSANLPIQRDPLIGRTQHLTEVTQLLRQASVGLVTLIGPGGVGKTRLALEVAAQLRGGFANGVWLVELAPISDPALVTATIAGVLGVKEGGDEPLLETLKAFLRERDLLIVIDNFEQVVEVAPVLSALLQASACLKLLVTSRIVLHVSDEHEYPVPPLAVPPSSRASHPLPSVEQLSAYAAVELFIQRAQHVKPDFRLSEQNAISVAEICVRLDGLPLAIELAAARSKVFAPGALLQRLSHPLMVLTGGAHDRHARQQTLRGTIDWSYSLLERDEQRLFARLGIFVGGCTIEAAEAVCNATQGVPGDLTIDVLEGLVSLVDKSLLHQVDGVDGEPRFMMLETLREYARERLAASGEMAMLAAQHAAFYLGLVEAAGPRIQGAEQTAWLDRVQADYDNLRAVFAWSRASPDGLELGLRLAAALGWFWTIRGLMSEARAVVADLLEQSRHDVRLAHSAVRAWVLVTAGAAARWQGEYTQACTLFGQSLAVFEEMEDWSGAAFVQYQRSALAHVQGDYGSAGRLAQDALKVFRGGDERWNVVWTLLALGDIALAQAELAEAEAHYQEALASAQHARYAQPAAWALTNLGRVARAQCDNAKAHDLLQQGLGLFRDEGDAMGAGAILLELGRVAHAQGDNARARALYRESLKVPRETGDRVGIAESLAGLAGVAGATGQAERGARLFGAVEGLRASVGAPLPPVMRVEYEHDRAITRAHLDDATWQAAWAEGQAMTLEQAIAYALEEMPDT